MRIIHGVWIPDKPGAFVRNGTFHIWLETDAPLPRRRATDNVHPRSLDRKALAAFLVEQLGLHDPYDRGLLGHTAMKPLLLPTAEDLPLPSHELMHYVDDTIPDRYDLVPWQVWCYQVRHVIPTLRDIHFIATRAADQFQLGTDLLFWYQFTQVLRSIAARDHYIPSLRFRNLAAGTRQGAGSKKNAAPAKRPMRYEIYPGWEFLSPAYESAIERYAASMPPACAAGQSSPDQTAPFAPEPLLRHFSECLLYGIVTGTPTTAKFEQQIHGSLLYECVMVTSSLSALGLRGVTLDDYRQWAAWRAGLTRTQTTAELTMCFQLEEPIVDDEDAWQIRFLIASKRDPSLKLSLAEYWARSPEERAPAVQAFGQEVERHALLALGHAARIYPRVWDGMDTDRPSGFRLSLETAFEFLQESAWVLEDAGFTVIVPAWWTPEGRRRARIRLKTSLRKTKSTSNLPSGFFSRDAVITYQYALSIGGETVSEAEWRDLVNAKSALVRFRGQWMELDREKMRQMLEFWRNQQHAQPAMTVLDMLRTAGDDADLEWEHDPALSRMLAALNDKSAFTPIADPPNLQGALREYQQRGVAWLRYLEGLGLNPCLADDMGLGKTIQVIAHMLLEKNGAAGNGSNHPTLLIAPTSVLGNWRKELERFAPELGVLVHQGAGRVKQEPVFRELCAGYDVVITSFTLARMDEKLLRAVTWHRVVVDEAQNIKNPQSAQARAILKLPAAHRMALTGTPVENRLRDLWSIFNFLNPGYLGREATFRKSFEMPIQKNNDLARATALKRLVEPFILRRLKTDKRIIADLPDKIEQTMFCNLTPEQASLYEAVVKELSEEIDGVEGIQRKGMMLATLLKLKQICNHPAQFLQDGSAFTRERSHKLTRLSEMLEEAIESGESLLVFTQFTEIGAALERYLTHTLHYTSYYLHGGTSAPRRERMVAEFQDPDGDPAVFILSLRAGGVGLNLTKANHVFHFDRWWNPAVEDQATDRAFRIGQRKNVFVHKFVAIGTLEERIDAMINDKKRMASTVVGADESWLTTLDNNTFKELIALRRGAIVE